MPSGTLAHTSDVVCGLLPAVSLCIIGTALARITLSASQHYVGMPCFKVLFSDSVATPWRHRHRHRAHPDGFLDRAPIDMRQDSLITRMAQRHVGRGRPRLTCTPLRPCLYIRETDKGRMGRASRLGYYREQQAACVGLPPPGGGRTAFACGRPFRQSFPPEGDFGAACTCVQQNGSRILQ